jgi:two-component system sensor kinase FixL
VPSETSLAPMSTGFRALMASAKEGLSHVWFGVLFLIAYLGFDQISSIGPAPPLVLTPWNPALGFCIAAAMTWRARVLPFLFLGPVLSQFVAPDAPHWQIYGLWMGVLSLACTALIVASANALAKYVSSPLLNNPVATVLLSCVPIALAAAAICMIILTSMGITPTAQFGEGVIRIWVGDVIGIVIITPLCLLVFSLRRWRFLETKITMEMLAQAAVVLGAVWLAFGEHPQSASRYFYIVFLPMIWIVLRSGVKGAIIMNAFVQLSMVVSLSWAGHDEVDVTLFQAILLVLAIASLTLGTAVDQSRNATQRLRARESELAASLKVAATGELAGTLAHELGHPLGAISNYAAALNHVIAKVAPTSEAVGIANKLSREIVRATDTLHRLRDFFRSGSLVIEHVDIGGLIRDAVSLLKDKLEQSEISPNLTIQSGLRAVHADRIQIHAVIHNLLINAIDALKHVSAERRKLYITAFRTAEAVVIEVDDSGIGVPADVREHIFEPLTTTKKDGLGLGLAMSRSVISAHGGRIQLESSNLGGAKFVVVLPLTSA